VSRHGALATGGAAAVALCGAAFAAAVIGCVAPAVAPPAVVAPARGDHDIAGVVPRLAAVIRAWNTSRDVLRGRLVDDLAAAGVEVVEGGRGLRAGLPTARLALVVRLGKVESCADREAGVVGGEPLRVLGCGAQGLAGLALFLTAAAALPSAPVVVVAGEDDSDIDALLPPTVEHVWVAEGTFTAGDAGSVLDVVLVDPGWLDVALRVSPPDVDRLLAATGRVVTWAPPPRLPVVIADRLALLPAEGPLGLLRADARTLANDPDRRAFVVDRCGLVDFPAPRDMASSPARLRCRVLPGRALTSARDDIVRAVDDPSVVVDVERAGDASATIWDAPVARALRAHTTTTTTTTAMSTTARPTIVAPTMSTAPGPSACAPLRRRGLACVGAVPVLTHPAQRARRGARDDAVDVFALVAGARLVLAVVEDVLGGR